MRLPKNFQPVGTSKKGKLCAAATRSNAPLVGIERATPCGPARQLNAEESGHSSCCPLTSAHCSTSY